jgi:dihydroorotate dehydrogenase electron transfer subunit
MLSCQARITRREEVATGHHLLQLHCPEVAAAARPGQFVHVRVTGTYDPLLRRPISVMLADARVGDIELLVRTVGRGTDILAALPAGSFVDLMGPLGNGFELLHRGQEPLLVAGGVGVAPLIFLADVFQMAPGGHYVRGLLGAATQDALACWQEFAGRCEEFEAATEDGSAGEQGLVTDLLAPHLERGGIAAVYTCGPRPMMAKVAAICAQAKVPCWASLEQFMGCGIGACLGCVVPTYLEPRHRRVCTDGPVFDASTIAWEEMSH